MYLRTGGGNVGGGNDQQSPTGVAIGPPGSASFCAAYPQSAYCVPTSPGNTVATDPNYTQASYCSTNPNDLYCQGSANGTATYTDPVGNNYPYDPTLNMLVADFQQFTGGTPLVTGCPVCTLGWILLFAAVGVVVILLAVF